MKPTEIKCAAGSKQAFHFGAPARPLFGFYHPADEGSSRRDAAVVLCNPLGTDHTRSDRTYRHLAQRLSSAGFPCLRFDFYGTGDSGGDEREPGLVRSWVDDVGLAIDELRARSGVRTVALVGLRLGATLALSCAAARGDVDALVLWSPCVSGASYLGEITKLHQIYLRIEPQMAGAPKTTADGEEALGLFLPREVARDLAAIDVLEMAGRPAQRALVIDGGGAPGCEKLVARLRDLGTSSELRAHHGHKFLMTVSHRALIPDAVLDSILGWLVDAYPLNAADGNQAPGSTRGAQSPAGESLLRLGDAHPLFAILTPGDPGKNRVPIVLTNAGCINRVGPHRMYVKMARRWAKLGHDVLRIDLSGIGDSPAAPGSTENLTYPSTGLADIQAAIDALGSRRAIVAGLCSGGDYAFQVGASGANVVGAWMINPRTFCVLDLVAVESGEGAKPLDSVNDVPKTLRAMAGRGVDSLLLVSRNDPGVAYVDAHSPDLMRELEGVSGFERVDLAGTDHTFTPVAIQELVSDLLTERLARLTRRGGDV